MPFSQNSPPSEWTYTVVIQNLRGRQTTLADQQTLVAPTDIAKTENRVGPSGILENICKAGNTAVVLWIPGRSDLFFHPHVAAVMLAEGYDVCVYNYTTSLRTTPPGSLLVNHVPSGSFDELQEEMTAVVASLTTKYPTVVVYAHSTGGTLLTNYLLQNPDHQAFRGLYLNAPFLEWGPVGGPATEKMLRHTPAMMDVWGLSSDLVLQSGGNFHAWRARLHTRFEMDVKSYPFDQKIHLTLGYFAAVQRVFGKLTQAHTLGKGPLTTVPVCMITAANDDVLDARETIERTAWIGSPGSLPNRILDHGSHDVFLSPDATELATALEHLRSFLLECQPKVEAVEAPPSSGHLSDGKNARPVGLVESIRPE